MITHLAAVDELIRILFYRGVGEDTAAFSFLLLAKGRCGLVIMGT